MRRLFFIFLLFSGALAMGCGPKMVTDFRQIGATQHNNVYGAMVASTNERGPAGMSLSIIAEQKYPGYQQTVISPGTSAQAPSAPAQLAKWDPPKNSPRGKKALICPPSPPPPPPKPVPAQPTVITTTTSPQLQVVGGAGGTGPSTLQSWGDALLSNAPMALGMWGAAKVLKPTRINVGGGNASSGATGGTGIGGAGGAGGAGGSASSSSSSASSASAAAAAAAGSGGDCH
ncbi:MAG: hypothetical protein A2359_00365 [Candidatus Moranbacteria bacterium RIFOXYB1_FULL_43_19]|nr:MAG: hypothetical protein A2359_00365 [Candidatus Moranbacteria bacterium RIFOXYB1_FULL_43_19]OGI33756.1 MAG: hypothetical protein A2420_05000 [Candidatus Moranbacteria bacterium RIFOXYC1_FULL_44_13]OGI38705.1 MAG: hypothetical protein A2612_00660 [Candidatus Moranbacteria bacterium RIFOXYD1_FULL_44_12]